MKKIYLSVDVEASGKTPGKYSLLSIGACMVHDISRQFYVELKPFETASYNTEAMRVASLGFDCLLNKKYLPAHDPRSSKFNPEIVLDVLAREGTEPVTAMADFAYWIKQESIGYRPVMAATPITFDGMFINWYFDQFYDQENPFGFAGEDMSSMARGVAGSRFTSLRAVAKLMDDRKPAHNALEDAMYQAKEFRVVLDKMRQQH